MLSFKRFLWVAVFAASSLAGPAWGASLGRDAALTLEQGVQMAQRRAPELAIAAADQTEARLRRVVAAADQAPRFSFEAGYLNSSSRVPPYDFAANNGPNETRAQLFARVPLDLGLLAANARRARAESEAARLGSLAVRAELTVRTSETFFAVLRAERTIEALDHANAGAQQQLHATRMRFANGLVSALDVRRTELSLALQRAARVKLAADLLQARDAFRRLTGANAGFRLQDPGVPETLLATGTGDRPATRQAAAQLAARQADVAAAQAARGPQLGAVGAVGWDTLGLPTPQNFGYEAGIDLSWPLWDAGRLDAQLAIAVSAARRAELALVATRRQAAGDRANARTALASAATQYRLLRQASAIADQALAMARFGFGEGSVGNLEVLAAQQAALDAHLALQNSLYDHHLALARLRWANGTI